MIYFNLNFKRVISVISICLAAFMCLSLASCGKKATEPEELLNSENSEADTSSDLSGLDISGGVIASVGGELLYGDDLGYYIYNNAVIQMYKKDAGTTADVAAFDWSQTDESGKPLASAVIENAVDDLINDTVFRQNAEACGYSVSADADAAEALISGAISENGEQGFLNNANLIGIKNSKQYIDVYTNVAVFEGVASELYDSPSKYIEDTAYLSDYAGTKGASVLQILISNDTSKGDAYTVAQEVLARAQSGEDFGALLDEYNEDSGEPENGYTFPEGEMISTFEDAAFALGIDEISGIVQSDYGYHIIKRIYGAYELMNYWRASADVQISDDATSTERFYDVLELISTAASREDTGLE